MKILIRHVHILIDVFSKFFFVRGNWNVFTVVFHFYTFFCRSWWECLKWTIGSLVFGQKLKKLKCRLPWKIDLDVIHTFKNCSKVANSRLMGKGAFRGWNMSTSCFFGQGSWNLVRSINLVFLWKYTLWNFVWICGGRKPQYLDKKQNLNYLK